MNRQRTPLVIRGTCVIVFAMLLLLSASAAFAAQEGDKSDLNQIPKNVIAALKAEFPTVRVHKWSREKEEGAVIYDIEFTQNGRKFEADIREDGTIDDWEKEIAARNLPEAVRRTFERKYPGAVPGEIMEITEVKGGTQALEGYEIVLETADHDRVEVTIGPDGRILEESGQGD